MRNRAFTLVELLTVLAILSIMAGLLFPVLANARESSRSAACASNLKQIGIAIQQYLADHDGGFPPARVRAPRRSWAALVQPYIRNWQVFRCPNMVDAGFAGRSIWMPPLAVPGNLSMWPAFGWNVDYLSAAQEDCSDFDTAFDSSGPPVGEANIGYPAETVLVAGVALSPGSGSWGGKTSLYPVNGGFCTIPAPATIGARDACSFGDGGWGVGSHLGPYGGFEAPRHRGRGNVLFVDGHVRSMTPEQLAVGTNWTPATPNTQVKITHRSRYLWDRM